MERILKKSVAQEQLDYTTGFGQMQVFLHILSIVNLDEKYLFIDTIYNMSKCLISSGSGEFISSSSPLSGCRNVTLPQCSACLPISAVEPP